MGTKGIINGVSEAVNVFGVKTSHYIIAATGLVVALSWNTAIKQSISAVYDVESDEIKANFIYALAMTGMLIILIWLLPDTKSELPSDTRRKLEQTEMETQQKKLLTEIEKNKKEMNDLKKQINNFERLQLQNNSKLHTYSPLQLHG